MTKIKIKKSKLAIIQKQKPTLILLDVMMPVLDGIEVCERIKADDQYQDILICFLTARNEDYSQIAGFDVGADDYITNRKSEVMTILEDIATELNLIISNNNDELLGFIQEVMNKYPDKVAEYKSGKKGLLGLFMGEVMKLAKGKLDPKADKKILMETLDK